MASKMGWTVMVAAAGVSLAAGLAMADGERLFFEVSNDISPTQPSTVVTLWATHDPRDYAVAAVGGDVLAGEGTWFDIAIVPPMDGPGTVPGIVDGSLVEGFVAGQLHSATAGIFADPRSPIAVWRGEVEVFDFAPRTIDLASMVTRFDVYIDRDSRVSESRLATLEQARGPIFVVPAPGAGALLLVSALAGVRRRR